MASLKKLLDKVLFKSTMDDIKKGDNPPLTLRIYAKHFGVSPRDAERYWEETKKQYMARTGKTKSQLKPEDYRYIMGVVKKRIDYKRKQKGRK